MCGWSATAAGRAVRQFGTGRRGPSREPRTVWASRCAPIIVGVLVSTTTATPSSGAVSNADAKPGTLPSCPATRCPCQLIEEEGEPHAGETWIH